LHLPLRQAVCPVMVITHHVGSTVTKPRLLGY
jgi:hypothetical protein